MTGCRSLPEFARCPHDRAGLRISGQPAVTLPPLDPRIRHEDTRQHRDDKHDADGLDDPATNRVHLSPSAPRVTRSHSSSVAYAASVRGLYGTARDLLQLLWTLLAHVRFS